MVTETLADKIKRIRNRLADIAREREAIPPEDFFRRSELLDEEHTLQARLGELQDEVAKLGVGIAEREAGEASEYERISDLPETSSM